MMSFGKMTLFNSIPVHIKAHCKDSILYTRDLRNAFSACEDSIFHKGIFKSTFSDFTKSLLLSVFLEF